MQTAIEHFEEKLMHEIDPSDLHAALAEGENIIVIDARKESAFEQEHIPGAINLPHRKMNGTSTLQFDRKAIYAIYCDGVGCNASTKGCLNMARLGFTVREIIGGLEYWKADGYATEGNKQQLAANPECAC